MVLTGYLVILLLVGCRGEEPSEGTFNKTPANSKQATASPERIRDRSLASAAERTQDRSIARESARVLQSAPSLLEEKEVQAKLAEPSSQNLPQAENLKVESRPFEGAKPVRQRLIKPLPSNTDPDTVRLVEQILTFDPKEPEPVARLRLAQQIRKLRDQNSFAALDALADTLRSRRLLQHDGEWILGYF